MSDAVVVDTDVLSYLFKRDSRATLYRPHLESKVLIISFMTVAELELWALQRNWGATRRRQLEEYLQEFLIFPAGRDLCRKWADVTDNRRRAGRPIQNPDAWIAATALANGVPLVTHNGDDYQDVTGLIVISEGQ